MTGGSKGIGRGMVQVFAEAGARVAIMACNGAQAQAAADEIGHGLSQLDA